MGPASGYLREGLGVDTSGPFWYAVAMKETLKALGLAALFFGVAMACLWGLLLVAKGYEDRGAECANRGGEILYNRCVDTIDMEGK